MKKLVMIGLMSYSLVAMSAHAATKTPSNKQSLDKMVAIVNDDVISRSELAHALEIAKLQIPKEAAAQMPEATLQKQVLDQLINKKVQLQIAKQAGVEIPDTELESTIKRIAKDNNMTPNELYARLNQDGMTTEEYRNEMRDQIIIHRLQQQEVASKITITSEEITHFKRSHPLQTNLSKEYHLLDILVPISEAPTPEEIIAAKTHADSILQKLNQGLDFETVAQTESSGTEAIQGGDLGWHTLPEIPTAFSELVVHMHDNETTGPIQTPNGFHIIRLTGVRPNKASHSMASRKTIESLLLQQKFDEAVQNWVSKLRSQAFIVTNL